VPQASRFLGLHPDEWTALGTVVLAMATAVFVVLTWLLARTAMKSAADSASAANSAREAARAAQTANELQIAQLPVDFSVSYRLYRLGIGNAGRLTVECKASTVYFHELRLRGASGEPATGPSLVDDDQAPTVEEKEAVSRGIPPTVLCPPEPTDFPIALPHVMHRGETVHLLYPRRPLAPGGSPYIGVRIHYSLTETGDVRSIDRDVIAWS
jgi:hypothetical protein